MDGELFDLGRFRAKSKIAFASVVELQYTGDAVVGACTVTDLQAIVDVFAGAYKWMGLTLNTRKTKALFPPNSSVPSPPPLIRVQDTLLENVEYFPHLGRHLSRNVDIDKEIQRRIVNASAAFGRLRQES